MTRNPYPFPRVTEVEPSWRVWITAGAVVRWREYNEPTVRAGQLHRAHYRMTTGCPFGLA